MKIKIKNIGKIEYAEVILDGITIVAGENNTGKSTIGKTLFSLLKGTDEWEESYYLECSDKLYEKVKKESEQLEEFCLKNTSASRRRTNRSNELIRKLCSNKEFIAKIEDFQYFKDEDKNNMLSEEYQEVYLQVQNTMKEYYKEYMSLYQKNGIGEIINENRDFFDEWEKSVINTLKNEVELDEVVLQAKKLKENFNSCFKNQYRSVSNDIEQCEVSFLDDDRECIFTISKNEEKLTQPIRNRRGVYFIESPKLFDEIGYNNEEYDLKKSLRRLMVPNSFLVSIREIKAYKSFNLFKLLNLYKRNTLVYEEEISKETNSILNMLMEEMNGQAEYYVKEGIKFKDKNISIPIAAQNVSTGLKAMAFLEYAIRIGAIQRNDILIFDEPEINLHPEWQVVYARALVVLQKIYGLTLLITSHSPYFIRAIECFSDKYEIMDKLNVYLMEKSDERNGKIWNVMESEYGMSELYERLTAPFDSLEEEINQKYFRE